MCPICSSEAEFIFNAQDNEFWQCKSCGHGFLKEQKTQDFSYRSGQTYYSKRCIRWSASKVWGRYECALDFGANDGFLLQHLRAYHKIGVDVDHGDDPEIEWHKSLDTVMERPDLVICRHTLEHLADPVSVLHDLNEVGASNAVFHVEVPCLDEIVDALRFDQIYNQHWHYFSKRSFALALGKAGFGAYFSYSKLGPFAQHAVCRRNADTWLPERITGIREAYAKYMAYMKAVNEVLDGKEWYAWGNSTVKDNILQWIHSKPAGVIDINEEKGLPPSKARGKIVLVTSPDNYREILQNATDNAVKHVISPSPFIVGQI